MMSKGGNPDGSTRNSTRAKGDSSWFSAPPVRRRLVGRALRRYRENLGLHAGRRGPDAGMRPVEDEPDRDRGAGHPGQGAARAPGRVRRRRRAAGHPGPCWRTRAARSAGTATTPTCCRGAWRDYLILETAASKISAYEAQRVPGLLQTPAYARALAEADPVLDGRRRAGPGGGGGRWPGSRRSSASGRPDVHLIIGQAALHQQVGSAAVMDEQLGAAGRGQPRTAGGHRADPAVRVRRARGRRGRVAGRSCSSPRHPGLGIVHLGGISGGVCLEGREQPAGLHGGIRSAAGIHARARRSPRCSSANCPAPEATLAGTPAKDTAGIPVACRSAYPAATALIGIAPTERDLWA